MFKQAQQGDWFDRWLPESSIVRLWGVVLLGGGFYLLVRGSWGDYRVFTIVLGLPAGLGMVLHRLWGRPIGLVLFASWGLMALTFFAPGTGPTENNWCLLFSAVGGCWTAASWED